MKIGTKVIVQRDETKYPPRGTGEQYRGRKGTVTCTALGEIGVSFTNGMSTDAYFQELSTALTSARKKGMLDAWQHPRMRG